MGVFDWFTKYEVTCDWDCHRARGSRGGEDRRHPVGSPVLAPYDATVTYGMYDDGASYVQFKYTNGYAHQAIHVQKDGRVPNGSRVAAGTSCAITDGRRGTFGAGTSTGQHCHFQGHAPDGTRIPWQDVPAPTAHLASISFRPFTIPEEIDMTSARIISYASPTHRNGIVLAAPGFWNPFTGEEWAYFSATNLAEDIPIHVPINDRAYDLVKSIYSPQGVDVKVVADSDAIAQATVQALIDRLGKAS
ncbi:peptidoglycan DD-metalloendopeptidase family protein [Microbacterium schleiferi]|uniref:Peptidoglycan DD-metalloendopeptidase family protein n=1 Tax=Microbacterium schleiferi TaxID=69362 RepID=A0A7S8MY26_9MICO|nr:M23 family metallopeptidase [Microbacterium schleiferi]QPE05319.1 peptidoglycan DD-metalloendopeptidase family protein [Microbacterium schleiferi]